MALPPLIIYALPGSQFVFKVLAAMSSRKIDHYVQLVSLNLKTRMKELPSGGHLVPELQVGPKSDGVIVSDSEKILHWLDENVPGANFYPNAKASELSERASDKTLAAMVWYYNWVDQEGYNLSMRATIGSVLPFFVPWFLVDLLLSSQRTKFRSQVKETLALEDDKLNDSTFMKGKLVEELKFFQDCLNGDFLIDGTSEPTAPDFSVYAQVQRLIGTEATDVPIPAAFPTLKDVADLQRLWQWYSLMEEKCPVKFKGKRPPKELLE